MEWVAPVCQYVMARLPKDERGGFNDHAMTAWQFGCMLLEACGYAEERPWGAAVMAPPKTPPQFPILEDVAMAVLTVAEQHREVSWRQRDGAMVPPRPVRAAGAVWTVMTADPPEELPPTVSATAEFGPARFADEVQTVLEQLSLIRDGQWRDEARPVLMRLQPSAWDMTVSDSVAFQDALGHCLATLPGDVKGAIAAINRPAPEHWVEERLAAHLAQQSQWAAEVRKRGHDTKPPDVDKLRLRLREGWPRLQTHEVEQLFYARWRQSLGWEPDGAKLLPLFHDRLANQMVKAVIEEMT